MKQFPVFLLILALVLPACAGRAARENYADQTVAAAHKTAQKGFLVYNHGCYEEALKLFSTAHEMFVLSDDTPGIALCVNNMGSIYRRLEDAGSALTFFEEAFRLYQQTGDQAGACQALCNRAAVLTDRQDFSEAQQTLDRARERAADNPVALIPVYTNQGILHMRQKKFAAAEASLIKALELTSPEETATRATVSAALGNLMQATQRYDRALGYFQSAYENDRERGAHPDVADDLAAMAECALATDRPAAAIDYLQRAVKMYALIGKTEPAGALYEKLTALAQQTGQDITLTSHFVKQWLQGDILIDHCR